MCRKTSLDKGIIEVNEGRWLLSSNQLWTLPMPWYIFVILKALIYVGKGALGTAVPLSILFLGLHFSLCFELSNIMAQVVGCQISVMFWVIV